MTKGFSFRTAACGAAAILLFSLSSCGGNDNRENFVLENYDYDVVAQLADSTQAEEAGGLYWRCQGSGVMPVKIGKHDISALRDTLSRIAAIDLDKKEPQPRLPEGYSDQLLKPGNVNAESQVINRLTVDLVTPEVMVFQNYHYVYPEGAAHGIYNNTYINYSLTDGRVLSLDDLFKPGYRTQLTEIVRNQLSDRDDLLVDLNSVELPENFMITSDGVTFIYSLFAIAPYSSGEIAVPVNAYAVNDALNDFSKKTLYKISD